MNKVLIFFLIFYFSGIIFCQVAMPLGVIPIAVHSPGAYDSFWRSDLYILNINDFPIRVYIELYGNDGYYSQKELILKPKENKVEEDVILNLFNLENFYGLLFISASDVESNKLQKIIVNSKTYTKVEGASYGQGVPFIMPPPADYIGYLNGIINNENFRTNIGIGCIDGGGSFIVKYFNNSGIELAEEYITLWNSGVYQKPVDIKGENIFASVEYLNGEGSCISYISQVDNKTNDGTFILAYYSKALGGKR